MAGRYVLVQFDHKEAAEAFVAANRGAIVGMFMRPDKFCECPDKKRQQANNWARGTRTGLYLCKTCRKPSVHHQRGIMDRLQYVFGWNLLGRD